MKTIGLVIFILGIAFATLSFNSTEENSTKEFPVVSQKSLEIQQRGCCSWHGGVNGCSGGRVVCSDGSYSPSCTCYSENSPLQGC